MRDNVTGLIWERKLKSDGTPGNQRLHDADDTYTWYSTDFDNNGGSPGFDNEGQNTCYGFKAGRPATYCNTEAYVKRVNAAGWCGFKDWRLPDRFELNGLADLSVGYYGGLHIDTGYFPDTREDKVYWSSSPYTSDAGNAWYVNFQRGDIGFTDRHFSYPVRLVRGGL